MADAYRVVVTVAGKAETLEIEAQDALEALGKATYSLFERLNGSKDLKIEVTKKGAI